MLQPYPVRNPSAQPAHNRATRDPVYGWLVALLLAIVLEGALRKWVLPRPLQPLAYGAKDVVAFLFVLRHGIPHGLRKCQRLRALMIFIGALLVPAFLVGCVGSIPSAIMVYKNVVLWPIFGITLAAWLTPRTLERFTVFLMIVAIPLALLGAVQFLSPPGARINQYAVTAADGIPTSAATFGGYVRATSTFSYLTGHATFGIVTFCWMLWRYISKSSPLSIILPGTVAALTIMLTSGSRAPILIASASLVAIPMFVHGTVARARAITLLLVMIAAAPLIALTPAGQAFIYRWTNATDTVTGRMALEGDSFLKIALNNPVGQGLGSQSGLIAELITQHASQLVAFSDDPRTRVARESGFPGLFGLVLDGCAVLAIIVMTFQSRDLTSRAAAGAFMVGPLYYFTASLWYDHVGCAMWWTIVGVWLGCLTIEFRRKRQNQLRRRQPVYVAAARVPAAGRVAAPLPSR